MSQRFEYGYGPRGYRLQLPGGIDAAAANAIRVFLQGIGWRPVGGTPAPRRARFVVPVAAGEAWSGEVWDDGFDPFGRPCTVAASGDLVSLEAALRRLGGTSLAVAASEAAGMGRAVLLATKGQLHAPDSVVLLDRVDESGSE
ncbi:hypothetical protein N9L45_00615 [Planctomycetota bacterium]|nr:hypothetical protein [Planctomycetota bacterium]